MRRPNSRNLGVLVLTAAFAMGLAGSPATAAEPLANAGDLQPTSFSHTCITLLVVDSNPPGSALLDLLAVLPYTCDFVGAVDYVGPIVADTFVGVCSPCV